MSDSPSAGTLVRTKSVGMRMNPAMDVGVGLGVRLGPDPGGELGAEHEVQDQEEASAAVGGRGAGRPGPARAVGRFPGSGPG